MLPAPIFPFAEHPPLGQNSCDASVGIAVLFIHHSIPIDAPFSKLSRLSAHRIREFYPRKKSSKKDPFF
jgi:hypothetical protein